MRGTLATMFSQKESGEVGGRHWEDTLGLGKLWRKPLGGSFRDQEREGRWLGTVINSVLAGKTLGRDEAQERMFLFAFTSGQGDF